MFLGSWRRNYSTEAANLLANLKADWSPSMAYIQTYNRTVNMKVKAEEASQLTKCWSITTCKWHSCIAASCIQLSVIQNVVYRIMKNAMSSARTFSFDHVKVISRTALFLMEAAHEAGPELSSTLSQRAHTTPSAENNVFL